MKLKIVNTGSVGNCYILDNGFEALVIECGVKFSEIKQALDFRLNKVAGVLITHEHGDHAKSVEEVKAAGINVYTSKGTIEALGVYKNSRRLFALEAMKKYRIGDFWVMPFDVKHDCKEPFGYLINHPKCGNVVFITDSYYVSHKFKNLNHVIVEANYCNEIVRKRMEEDTIHKFVRDRVIQSHMSIQTCKELLKANDLSAVNNIVLIHLSDRNSDAASFKKQVEELTGKNVHVASKGMEINLSKTPF